MEAKAIARYLRMSPRKARRVLQLIKGHTLQEAHGLLTAMPHRAARVVRRVMESAAANAESNHGMDRDELWVAQAYADAGPSLKRWRAASGGRISMIQKRTSHICVVLSDEELLGPPEADGGGASGPPGDASGSRRGGPRSGRGRGKG